MKIQKALGGILLATAATWAAPTLSQVTGWSLPGIVDGGAESVVLTDVDGVNDDATAFLLFELAGNAGSNSFGIYGFTTNPDGSVTLGETLQLFAGPAAPIFGDGSSFPLISSTTVAWNAAHTVATANGVSANIGTNFGFYIANGSFRAYTHSSLNTGNADMAGIYDVTGATGPYVGGLLGSDVVVAFEDVYGGDFDYNDLVVGVTDVAPVPEPGTLGLIGLGLFAVGFAARRRKTA